MTIPNRAPLKPHGLLCFLDLDGVLVDLVTGFIDYLGIDNPYHDPDNLGQFDRLRKINVPEGKDAFDDLDYHFWANLPPMPDGPEIYEMVEWYFGKGNICLLSSPTRNPESAAGKLAWINQHYPQLSRSFFLGTAKHFAASRNKVLVDDFDYNVEVFREAGGQAILIPRLWNSHHSFHLDALETLRARLDNLKPSNPSTT